MHTPRRYIPCDAGIQPELNTHLEMAAPKSPKPPLSKMLSSSPVNLKNVNSRSILVGNQSSAIVRKARLSNP